ncbi:MAG: hypothetical protein FWD71_09695 [Oscillospiraceae bacterium]|nr:hypothetical protein [Oscillospiraceae bacterium]
MMEKDYTKPENPGFYRAFGFSVIIPYGEVVGLHWESINFEANTITIEHTVTIATIDGKRIIVADDTTKSKSSFRTLPLVPAIRSKLLEVYEEQEQNRRLCGKSYNNDEAIYLYRRTWQPRKT